jgi:hypothetical protein
MRFGLSFVQNVIVGNHLEPITVKRVNNVFL